MKKLMHAAIAVAFCVLASSTVSAQVIVDDSFDTYGTNVDLNAQADWVTSTNDAFVVTTNEVLLAKDGQRLVLGGGTEVDLWPGDTVEITIDHRFVMPPPTGQPNFSVMSAGLQVGAALEGIGFDDAVPNYVAYNNYENGSINYFPDSDQWWGSAAVAPRFRADNYDFGGFDHKPNVGVVADPDSDPLRLVYSFTKSHVTNEFSSTIDVLNLSTNLTGSASKDVMTRPNAWAASNLTFFVASLDNGNGPNSAYVDSVKVEIIPPSAAPTGVSALGLQGEVLLTWNPALGAAEYDVYRSTTSGVFLDPPVRVAGYSYSDTAVVNGTEYFYVVQAVYYNGNSGDSAQASAEPRDVYRDELVISSDFSTETPGDLAGQAPWLAISESGPNAFNVIAGPPTAADTVSAEANFALTNGNAVVVDLTLSNEEDDAIEGYFDVVVSASPSGGVANAYADMSNQAVLDFGLTGNSATALRAEGEAIMALLTLHVRNEGNMYVGFGTTANDNDNNRLAYMDRDDANWFPNDKTWDFVQAGSPAADLETDPMRVEFKIRKTREAGVYQAWASISNLTTGIASTFTGPEYVTINRQDLYDMPASLFALGHSDRAQHIDGTRVRDSVLHATVRELSVTHTIANAPEVMAPVITSLTRGDREVSFSWDPVLDATGGYTITLETPNGEVYTIADGTNVTSFTDSPRWNDISNTYTLQANFDGDLTPSVASTNFDAAPVGLVPVYAITSGEWTDGSEVTASLAGLTTNGLRYVDYMTTPVFQNGVGGYTGPTLYGLFQGMATGTSMEIKTSSSKTMYNHGGWGNWGEHLTFATLSDLGHATGSVDATGTQLYYYVKAGSWSFGEWNFAFRAAIRNGTDWYVSQTNRERGYGGGGGGDKPLLFPNIMDETWLALTIAPGNDMLVGVAVDNSTLTDVNAVGWFTDQLVNSQISDLEVKVSGALPSYDYWADSMGLVSSNSAPALDPDLDGLENEREFAFGGDPLTADTATLPMMEIMGAPGSEYIQYIYKKQRDPGASIGYVMKSTTDLVNGDANSNYGIWSTNNHTSAEGVADYYWMNVTNNVPFGTGIGETFIDLEIQ